jgi:hypothetical protein
MCLSAKAVWRQTALSAELRDHEIATLLQYIMKLLS